MGVSRLSGTKVTAIQERELQGKPMLEDLMTVLQWAITECGTWEKKRTKKF